MPYSTSAPSKSLTSTFQATKPAPHFEVGAIADYLPPVQCQTGVIFRNPRPQIQAVHAWHPTVILLGGKRLLATFDLGQAVESLDYRTYSSYSDDEGLTWSQPMPVFDDPMQHRSTHTVRPAMLRDGSLVAVGGRHYRDRSGEGICNRANLGLVEMDLLLLRSWDEGRTWTAPQILEPPLVGPAFEIAHGIVELTDGRWLWPTSTWRGWDGAAPNGMKAIALVSYDQGKTWPQHVDIFDGYPHGILHFETSLVVMRDGRLLAFAWALDELTGRTRDVVYSVSDDGTSFPPPRSTGLPGETSKLVVLPDGRAACFFRSLDVPGLGAALISLDGDELKVTNRFIAWHSTPTALVGNTNAADELAELKLGYPSPLVLPNGSLLCAFWCRVNEVNEIRWIRWKPERIKEHHESVLVR